MAPARSRVDYNLESNYAKTAVYVSALTPSMQSSQGRVSLRSLMFQMVTTTTAVTSSFQRKGIMKLLATWPVAGA